MNSATRLRLVEAVKDIQVREILTYIYRDQPQGCSFEGLKEILFLHDAFEEARLTALVTDRILTFNGKRYTIAPDARQVLDRDATILMDEFLR